ncbi:MAG: hypothetical protein ABIR96_06685 [Bdellovibrionota bacterium]
MDIRGISKARAFLGNIIDVRQKPVNASADRDAHRNQQQERRQFAKLTQAEVEEAFFILVESLGTSGLRAEHVKDPEGDIFIVKDMNGKTVRELKGLLITDLFLKGRAAENTTSGTLLKRSA